MLTRRQFAQGTATAGLTLAATPALAMIGDDITLPPAPLPGRSFTHAHAPPEHHTRMSKQLKITSIF